MYFYCQNLSSVSKVKNREETPMNGHELLALLAPPLDLVDWLERIFAAKQAKGEAIPAAYVQWLQTWQDIRSAGECAVDGTKQETWAQVFEILMQSRKELAF